MSRTYLEVRICDPSDGHKRTEALIEEIRDAALGFQLCVDFYVEHSDDDEVDIAIYPHGSLDGWCREFTDKVSALRDQYTTRRL